MVSSLNTGLGRGVFASRPVPKGASWCLNVLFRSAQTRATRQLLFLRSLPGPHGPGNRKWRPVRAGARAGQTHLSKMAASASQSAMKTVLYSHGFWLRRRAGTPALQANAFALGARATQSRTLRLLMTANDRERRSETGTNGKQGGNGRNIRSVWSTSACRNFTKSTRIANSAGPGLPPRG